MATYSFDITGSSSNPTSSIDFEISDPYAFDISGSLTGPITSSLRFSKAIEFVIDANTNSLNNTFDLVSDPSAINLISYPSGYQLGNRRSVDVRFSPIYTFSINVTLNHVTTVIPFTKPQKSFSVLLITHKVTGGLVFDLVRRNFVIASTLHHTTANININRLPLNYVINASTPHPLIPVRFIWSKTDVSFGGTPIPGSSGSYDPTNQINDEDGFESITVRRPELGNRISPAINPKMQVSLSKKLRTYIETPALYNLSMTWKLLNCNDTIVESLAGLLNFEQIYFVLENQAWMLVLLDDAHKTLYEARSHGIITLNFRGRKLN